MGGAPRVARGLVTADARHRWPDVVRLVGVQALGARACAHDQTTSGRIDTPTRCSLPYKFRFQSQAESTAVETLSGSGSIEGIP
jgi:hypothetical protein